MAKVHLGTRVDAETVERIAALQAAMSTQDFEASESFVTRAVIEKGLSVLEAERGVTSPAEKRARKSKKEAAT